MTSPRVYLDHNATSPVRPEVAAAVGEALTLPGNPSSIHGEGRAARAALERARDAVARRVGAGTGRVVFTSGGTEAANAALSGGLARVGRAAPTRLLVGATEPPCGRLLAGRVWTASRRLKQGGESSKSGRAHLAEQGEVDVLFVKKLDARSSRGQPAGAAGGGCIAVGLQCMGRAVAAVATIVTKVGLSGSERCCPPISVAVHTQARLQRPRTGWRRQRAAAGVARRTSCRGWGLAPSAPWLLLFPPNGQPDIAGGRKVCVERSSLLVDNQSSRKSKTLSTSQ